MRVLLASSEVHPYSKTGGLADMVGALAKAMAGQGHQVGLVTPLYAGIRERFSALRKLDNFPIDLPLGLDRVRAEIWTLNPVPGVTIYFVDQPDFYQRAELYQKDGVDFSDNAERFYFLSKVVVQLALHLPWKPEIVHLHDWQVGPAALLLHHQSRLPGWQNTPPVCLTIHNLAYQGLFPASTYPLLNLPWDYYTPAVGEFYGKVNCLKAGIAVADVITTVSPRYAREITTEEFGCGLDGLLRLRQRDLFGIINGVDYSEWNTTSANEYIKHPYWVSDLGGKSADKLDLQTEMGLPPAVTVPLFGNIGRMVEQKGIDIALPTLEEVLKSNLQVVILGSGAPKFQRAFQDLALRYPDQLAVKIGYDPGLAHRIEAGADFFLMPSRFEPCGLNQMYSLRYGTIPIVRATGGLDDTVLDIKENLELANGIKFSEYSPEALTKAIWKALALYGEPGLLKRYRVNAMHADFSWDRTSREYGVIYERIAARRGRGAVAAKGV